MGLQIGRTAIEPIEPQSPREFCKWLVVWMSLPNREDLQPSHRPVWPSIEAAEAELRQQAERLAEEEGTEVRAIVVDGSLR